jgi:hypothetical protein
MPRFSFRLTTPIQPDLPAFAMSYLDLPHWAHNLLIPGSTPGGAIAPNHRPPGSCPSRFD